MFWQLLREGTDGVTWYVFASLMMTLTAYPYMLHAGLLSSIVSNIASGATFKQATELPLPSPFTAKLALLPYMFQEAPTRQC